MSEKMTELVDHNKLGWLALQHKDGWWVGSEKGVTCFKTRVIAQAALTIACEREGARHYKIRTFTGAPIRNGEHTPKYSGAEALAKIERRANN